MSALPESPSTATRCHRCGEGLGAEERAEIGVPVAVSNPLDTDPRTGQPRIEVYAAVIHAGCARSEDDL